MRHLPSERAICLLDAQSSGVVERMYAFGAETKSVNMLSNQTTPVIRN